MSGDPTPDATGRPTESVVTPTRQKRRRAAVPDDALTWEYHIPLLTNRFMVWDFARVMLIVLVVMEVLFFAIGLLANGEPTIIPVEIVVLPFGIIATLVVFAVVVVFKNDYHVRYTLDSKRVVCDGHLETGIAYRILIALGMVMRSPFGLLAVILARGNATPDDEVEGDWDLKWLEVRKITAHIGPRVVTLASNWWMSQRLYCPPEIFDEVVVRARSYTEDAARRRGRRPRRAEAVSPATRGLVVWASMAGVATFLGQLWEKDDTAMAALVAGGLVLVARLVEGFWRRVVGLLAAGASLLYLLTLHDLANRQTDFAGGYIVIYGYEHETELLIVAVACGIVLLGMGGLRLLGGRGGAETTAKAPRP